MKDFELLYWYMCTLSGGRIHGKNWHSAPPQFLPIGYLLKGISKIPEILFLLNNPDQRVQMGEIGTQNLPANASNTYRTNVFS